MSQSFLPLLILLAVRSIYLNINVIRGATYLFLLGIVAKFC